MTVPRKKKTIGVIPARYASTRFPGKPLAFILGKPLIQWVVHGALQAKLLDEVLVATDHEGIATVAREAGAKVVMTDADLPSGSDRVWAAVKDLDCDLVINIQGDEPLVQGALIDTLVQGLIEGSFEMATLSTELSAQEMYLESVVKVISNQRQEAIYFSRFAIPYSRERASTAGPFLCQKHIGMYGYQKSFLEKFCNQPPVGIEVAESLEQLRAIYLGAKILVLPVPYVCIGVDTPEDVARAEAELRGQG